MSKSKYKIIFTLRLKIALELEGFTPISEMANPRNENLRCWVFDATPAFLEAFTRLSKEV